ncbi:hypothetical protein CFOL_v3_10715 [Cephalotus follicularis]|uniref:Uncharacterized protein n=1 Tax=Cephalotus follicularis TaxID=3775 RepID=A0A1Q3BGR4_CEPFO|nr:hypothetical protein CFOL_v3_10715 [Cephalotus follicularis]
MSSKTNKPFKTKQSYSIQKRQLPPTITNIQTDKSLIPLPKPLTTIYSDVVKNTNISHIGTSKSISTQNPDKTIYKHIKNPCTEFLFFIEPEFRKNCQTPTDIAKRVFYPDWHYYNNHSQKTQTFYEFILVDTDSMKTNPKSDPKNPGLITHTSVFILKILTLAEWGQNPHYFKQFTASFDLPIYNYFDYMDAWKNTFLFQNNEDRHSWFFCFDKTFKKQNIPYWFVDW